MHEVLVNYRRTKSFAAASDIIHFLHFSVILFFHQEEISSVARNGAYINSMRRRYLAIRVNGKVIGQSTVVSENSNCRLEFSFEWRIQIILENSYDRNLRNRKFSVFTSMTVVNSILTD